jgi:hypothetical protein
VNRAVPLSGWRTPFASHNHDCAPTVGGQPGSRDHQQHLGAQVQAITAPAMRLAEQRRIPWWR